MDATVTVLDDNIAAPPSFLAEHGLSVLVEVGGRSFLWDCWQSDLAVRNARSLGIDLGSTEGIGISHGHFDHATGLLQVLTAAGRKKVFMHPEALVPIYVRAGRLEMFIGIPYRREAIEGASPGLELATGPVEVMPNVSLTGEIPRVTDFEGPEPTLYSLREGEMVPDSFTDDQTLVVDTPEGAVVLTGCAHSGTVNILKHVFGTHGRMRAVVGGTNLGLGSESRLEPTVEFLAEVEPDRMVFCHSKGLPAIAEMMARFKDRFIPGRAGMRVGV